MKNVRINSSGGVYEVMIENGAREKIGGMLSALIPPCHVTLITDDRVDALYGDAVIASLTAAGYRTERFVFPAGEAQKTMDVVVKILDFMAERQMTRSDLVVALGGGVCGDIAGFAAGIYLRGIRFVQVPTTLLAAVDSSVGGKTGVNLTAGKNLAGVFWQPALVICDPQVFSTLPETVLADGTAESIKHGMLADPGLFSAMTGTSEPVNMDWEEIVARNVAIKAEFVAADTRDQGVRQLLNFGHTIGHAIEKCSAFQITHGHAVSIGMVAATRAAVKRGICQQAVLDALQLRLRENRLPTECRFSADELTQAAMRDKKRSGGQIQFVLPEAIGCCRLVPLATQDLPEFIASAIG